MINLKTAKELRKITEDFIKTVDIDRTVKQYIPSLAMQIEDMASEGESVAIVFARESYRVKIYRELIKILEEKEYKSEIVELKDGRTILKVSW